MTKHAKNGKGTKKEQKQAKNTTSQQWETGNFLVSVVEDIETLSYKNRTPTVKAKAVSSVLFLCIAGFMKAAD